MAFQLRAQLLYRLLQRFLKIYHRFGRLYMQTHSMLIPWNLNHGELLNHSQWHKRTWKHRLQTVKLVFHHSSFFLRWTSSVFLSGLCMKLCHFTLSNAPAFHFFNIPNFILTKLSKLTVKPWLSFGCQFFYGYACALNSHIKMKSSLNWEILSVGFHWPRDGSIKVHYEFVIFCSYMLLLTLLCVQIEFYLKDGWDNNVHNLP